MGRDLLFLTENERPSIKRPLITEVITEYMSIVITAYPGTARWRQVAIVSRRRRSGGRKIRIIPIDEFIRRRCTEQFDHNSVWIIFHVKIREMYLGTLQLHCNGCRYTTFRQWISITIGPI